MSADDLDAWLWESWRFVKQIFPLLVMGVFVVGMIRVVLRPEWIESLAGANTVLGNLAGVAFGVFMYFPTLVEVPIARMFLDLGMHRGPLLAYLMADPELSLQSILIISAIIGRRKAWTYVALVALFSTVAGLTYGAWMDGSSLLSLALGLAGFIAVLAALLSLAGRIGRFQAKESDHVEHQGSRPRLRQLPETRRDRPRSRGFPGRRRGDRQGHRHAADHRLRRAEDARAGDQREAGFVRPDSRTPVGGRLDPRGGLTGPPGRPGLCRPGDLGRLAPHFFAGLTSPPLRRRAGRPSIIFPGPAGGAGRGAPSRA